MVEHAELDIPSRLDRTARKVEQTGQQLEKADKAGKTDKDGREAEPAPEPSSKRPRFWRQPDRGPGPAPSRRLSAQVRRLVALGHLGGFISPGTIHAAAPQHGWPLGNLLGHA